MILLYEHPPSPNAQKVKIALAEYDWLLTGC
jgi:glutathione S-transferase